MGIAETDWEAAVAVLETAGSIGVVGHVRPDGDALGASVGLAHAARAAGKDAVVSFGEPFALGDEYDYLDLSVVVPPDEFPGDLDLAVVCDTGVLERVGSVAPRVASAATLLVIDHHMTGGDTGDILLVDPTAAATTELVYRLLERMGWPISKAVADALYTGLVTDTGRFMYSSTTAAVHDIAGALIDRGVEPAVVGQHLYERVPFGYYAVAADVLGRAVLDEDAGLVWSVVTQDDIERAEVGWESTDQLIDLVRLAEESGVALLLKQIEPGTLKGSLRSRGVVDVAAVAGAFGGGGHHNAAGFTANATPEAVVAKVAELLT